MGDLFLLGFRSKILYSFLISPMDVVHLAHLIILDFITLRTGTIQSPFLSVFEYG